jgi:flagellar assembly protein FliH
VSNKEQEVNILRNAKRKAQILMQEAQKKAEDILKSAQDEREGIRKKIEQEIAEELRTKIIPEAKARAYEEGLAKAEEEALKIQLQAKQYLDYAQNALAFELKRVDKELLNLSIKLSEKIIGVSLALEPRKLLPIIQKLTMAAGKKDKLKLYVSEEDFVWLKELPEKIKPAYPIAVDSHLSQGDTYLESREGFFEGQISSQLDIISETLFRVLEDDQLAATGSDN